MSAAASYWRNAVRHPEDCGVGNIRRTMDWTEFGQDLKLPIGCLEAGAVPLRISTYVQTAVTGGTPAVTIGTSTDPDAFAVAADIAVGSTGYKTAATGVEMGKALAADTMFFAYISASAATGKFTMTVEFANRREAIPFREDATDSEDGEEGGGEEGGLEELAFADFVNGVYRIGGATVAVGVLFTEDVANEYLFNPVTDITVDGLVGRPILTPGVTATLLASGFTFVMEYRSKPAELLGEVRITAADLPDFDGEWWAQHGFDLPGGTALIQNNKAGNTLGLITGTPTVGGLLRMAGTIIDTSCSSSANGGVVSTATKASVASFAAVNTIIIESPGSARCFIEKITFYPPQLDADLSELSEP